jgi:hypothetical protein
LNPAVLKTVRPERVSGVRIPPPPPPSLHVSPSVLFSTQNFDFAAPNAGILQTATALILSHMENGDPLVRISLRHADVVEFQSQTKQRFTLTKGLPFSLANLYKRKYESAFPTVRTVDAAPGPCRGARAARLCRAAPTTGTRLPVTSLRSRRKHSAAASDRTWPDHQRWEGPPTKEGDGPDRNMASFFWCMRATQRGWSIVFAISIDSGGSSLVAFKSYSQL